MYRRYSNVSEGMVSVSHRTRNRIKDLVILLLVAAVAALCIIGIPAVRKGQDARSLYIQRMRSECDEALRLSSALSRNAGASSASTLAKVRSNLVSIRTINSLAVSQGMGELVDSNSLQDLQDSIDRYLDFLTTGMDTGEYQTNLQNALTDLQYLLNHL